MNRHRKRAPDARKWWDQKKQLFRGQLLSRDRNFRTRQEKRSGIFFGAGIPGPGFIFSLIQNRPDLPRHNHRRTGPAHFFGFENQDRTSSEPVLSSRSGAQNLPGPARPGPFLCFCSPEQFRAVAQKWSRTGPVLIFKAKKVGRAGPPGIIPG